MRKLLIAYICSAGLAAGLFAQNPAVTPANSPVVPSAAMSPTMPTISPAASASGDSDLADQIHRKIDKKLKQKGLHFTIGDEDGDGHVKSSSAAGEDFPEAVIPLVGIIFLTVFGAPVLIVVVIMYFGFSKNRIQHRTIRML